MIEFQKPYGLSNSKKYINDCMDSSRLEGDGKYTHLCEDWLCQSLGVTDIKMMTSCTHALELALNVIELRDTDEVIVPSFTYPSTANAVLMAGGKVVFSQVKGHDLTLDPDRMEEKITKNTRAIIPVHYGGNICDMDRLMAIARAHKLVVIEDSAQSFLSTYKGMFAGTMGDFGCYSFHGTKDIVAGEGGALLVNNKAYLDAVKVFRDKGTNREAFLKGEIDYYEWVAKGSSYGPSDLLMAMLLGQLELSHDILRRRQEIFQAYWQHFVESQYDQLVTYSQQSKGVRVNGHIFYLVFKEASVAVMFRTYLKENHIMAYTHFLPLHSSHFGKTLSEDAGGFDIEAGIGQRLVRLPIYPSLEMDEVNHILEVVHSFMEVE